MFYSQVDICRQNHEVCYWQQHMSPHFCKVALCSHQIPCHNAGLWHRSKKHVSATLRKHLDFCCWSTFSTCIPSAAFTPVAVGELDAVVGASGVTRIWQTLIDVPFTALTYITRWAHTLVASNAVHTLAIVKALGLISEWVSEGVAVI